MKPSRRDFIHAGCVAAAIALTPHFLDRARAGINNPGSASGGGGVVAGKVQVGLAAMFGQTDLMFINCLRNAQSTWQAFLSPTGDPYALLNADGYPNAFAAGTTQWRLINNGAQLQDPADGFNGRWILDWTCAPGATATLDAVSSGAAGLSQSTFSTTTNPIQNGRIVYNLTSGSVSPGTPILWQVNITAITGQITNVRLYPARYETLLATQQWDPDFLNFYKVWGRVRFMDWMSTNGNPITRWEQRCLPTQVSQNGNNITAPYYCGLCTSSKGDFTTATDIPAQPGLTSWTDGLMIQANIGTTVAQVNVQSFTLGATTTVNATAHGFVNGDLVGFSNNAGGGTGATGTGFMLGQGSPVFTVANALTNSFELSGINSSTWNGTASGSVHYAMRFKAGSLPFKAICGGDGNVLFGVPPSNIPLSLFYDADFDRLIYSTAPNGAGNGNRQGMGIETAVSMANALGPLVQPWFCLPHNVDATYVTNWATYILNNLDPAIKFSVEVSNEVWNINSGFIQTQNYTFKGALKWAQPPLNNTDVMFQYYGFRFRQIMLNIGAVFSGQMSRVNRVFAQQTINASSSTPTTQTLHRMQCPLGGFTAGDYPINYADSMCIAPYYNLDRGLAYDLTVGAFNTVYGNAGQVTTGLAYLDGRQRSDASGQGSMLYYAGTSVAPFTNIANALFGWWSAIATANGVKLTAYEGGFNALSGSQVQYGNLTNPYTPSSNNIVSGTYNSGTGAVDLILNAPYPFGFTNTNLVVAGLTGTGSVASLNGTFNTTGVDFPSSGHITFTGPTGLGAITITGGSCCQYQADLSNAWFKYSVSSVYAAFLTDAGNAFIQAGGEFPSQYCGVNGSWAPGNPFSIKQPNRLAADTPPYLAWRALNGR